MLLSGVCEKRQQKKKNPENRRYKYVVNYYVLFWETFRRASYTPFCLAIRKRVKGAFIHSGRANANEWYELLAIEFPLILPLPARTAPEADEWYKWTPVRVRPTVRTCVHVGSFSCTEFAAAL